MPATKDPQTDYRYERKFVVSALSAREIMMILQLHPAMFSEIYHPRWINNIYFDTEAMDNYFDNVGGTDQRIKGRIRWYGDLRGPVERPVLEFKIKRGLVGTKERFPVAPFRMDESLRVADLQDALDRSDLSELARQYLRSVSPTLLNRYRRQYFQTSDEAYRVTIDTDLSFYRVGRYHNSFLNNFTDRTNTIVELKYDREDEEAADRVTRHFPFRLTKSSKYVTGVALLHER